MPHWLAKVLNRLAQAWASPVSVWPEPRAGREFELPTRFSAIRHLEMDRLRSQQSQSLWRSRLKPDKNNGEKVVVQIPLRKDTCSQCAAYVRTGPDVGECHAAPPHVVSLQKPTAMGMQLEVLGVFAPTKSSNWCMHFFTLPEASPASELMQGYTVIPDETKKA